MARKRSTFRNWSTPALAVLALALSGQGCLNTIVFPPPPPEPVVIDTVDAELVNETACDVDPGLVVDGSAVVLDPPLMPGEEPVWLDVDCFAGTTLQADATLLASEAVLSANAPVLQEGVDFLCGDTVTFLFIDNGAEFFVRPLVNDVLAATSVDVALVNETGYGVDPGLVVDGSAVVLDPPLASGETPVWLAFDCVPGSIVQADATLLISAPLVSLNVPVLEEGVDFLCGDRITFVFIDDGWDFYTEPQVNSLVVPD